MNLFLLSRDPRRCARYHNNKHCVKMILEVAQLLCTAWHVLACDDWVPPESPKFYRKTHVNHPMAKWVRHHCANYTWAVRLGLELCEE